MPNPKKPYKQRCEAESCNAWVIWCDAHGDDGPARGDCDEAGCKLLRWFCHDCGWFQQGPEGVVR